MYIVLVVAPETEEMKEEGEGFGYYLVYDDQFRRIGRIDPERYIRKLWMGGLSAQRAYPSFNSAQPIKSPRCEGKGYARHGTNILPLRWLR